MLGKALAKIYSTFLSLLDTPSSYSGQGGKFVKVNSGETGLEFGTGGGGGGSITLEEVDGTPSIVAVTTIKVTNASLTDEGGGVARINFPFDIDGGNFSSTFTYNNNFDGGAFV